jgi:hypothetical protein
MYVWWQALGMLAGTGYAGKALHVSYAFINGIETTHSIQFA